MQDSVTPGDWDALRASLEALDPVVRVLRDEEGKVWLVCEPGADRRAVEEDARGRLAALGISADDVELEALPRLGLDAGRRVRFERIERFEREHRTAIRVTLGWREQVVRHEAVVETSPALELRAAANATLGALDALLGGGVPVRLVGVKPLRAFDADLVAVSLLHPGPPPAYYVGAVLAGRDPLHAAGLAVLDALNRKLGGWFERPS